MEENVKPSFDSYKGSQNIVTADRVIILGKNDITFILGKKAVSIASPGPVNMDSDTSITLRAPKVKLGLTGLEEGQPVLLGSSTVDILVDLITSIKIVAQSLSNMSETNLATSVVYISSTARSLADKCDSIRGLITKDQGDGSYILSKTTFTK